MKNNFNISLAIFNFNLSIGIGLIIIGILTIIFDIRIWVIAATILVMIANFVASFAIEKHFKFKLLK